MTPTHDLNILGTDALISPRELSETMPISPEAAECVLAARADVRSILRGEDSRLLVVVGPCSIHDSDAALEYAQRLAIVASEVSDTMLVTMRVYFEKPRTTVGWKGLINDPHLDDSFDMNGGLRLARELLLQIVALGLPAATEMLDPITPQYISDLVALAAIGARTTESPTHRQMASGLSMPVGYKNSTGGDLKTATDAMLAARAPHSFLGIDYDGRTCIVNTRGNDDGFLILRGGTDGPNYDAASVANADKALAGTGLSPHMMVDCSHANSDKDHRRQRLVWDNVLAQKLGGTRSVVGMMVESNLQAGNQKVSETMQYGVSITDACINWPETEDLLRESHATLKNA
ncbi:MAG TPA: 3-deoxy-7-phosphoheptulonate synthase [Lentisphaeria bacterium]|nr:3-deoxy-7-phosphoheptulonate synthase [Lentisphaeria bacterium]